MNLVQALRLVRMDSGKFEEPPCFALVGAGGKTTALFQIGRQLPGPVILTATTHLGVQQAKLADRHLIARRPSDLDPLETPLPNKVTLLTGPPVGDGRLSGVDSRLFEWLYSFTEEYHIPLVIEADGSRQRPVKAPGDHEPAIPSFVRQVCVVAGLSAIGKPIAEKWVHRPGRFASITGLEPGSAITVDSLADVLKSPQGGLKGIPPGARRIALLTQAGSKEQLAHASLLAKSLLPAFHAVLAVSTVAADANSKKELGGPINPTSLSEPVVYSAREPAAAVLLAAGGSSRMGRPKQLLPWHGEPMVRFVASKALSAGFFTVVVVTGAYHEEVSLALEGLPIKVTYNEKWKSGQSSSVQAGLNVLPVETGSATFLLVDQPQVPAELIRSLLDLHAETLAPVVAPRVGERRANPVLFDRLTFPGLMSIQGDVGGRTLFTRFPVTWLDWQDENLLLDIDTDEDYQKLSNVPLL